MANNDTSPSGGAGTPQAAEDDPLGRPFSVPLTPIPGIDVDVDAEAGARAIGARIPRQHHVNGRWNLTPKSETQRYSHEEPIDHAASYLKWRVSSGLLAGIFVSPLFYPLAMVRGGDWLSGIWITLGVTVVSLPLVALIEGVERDDPWRWHAAHLLGVATMALVVSWWGVMTRPAVFAAAYPIVLAVSIVECVFILKRRVRPINRRRLLLAAAIISALTAIAAIAKLVYVSRGGDDDGIPIVVNYVIAFAGVALSIRLAQAPSLPAEATPASPAAD